MKIGYLPGIEQISDKTNLGQLELPYVPKTFILPNQLTNAEEYAHLHPEAVFMSKWNTHHGIKFISPQNFPQVKSDSHIQEAIHPPFLIKGHKFDISCHVIVSCIEPLRIYRNK